MTALAPAPIAVQLYTLREQAATNFRGVLERLGAAGYRGVELAGFHDLTPDDFARVAADNNIEVASAHINMGRTADLEAAIDTHLGVGATTMVIPMMPPDGFADLEAIDKTAGYLNKANTIARTRNVKLGYHNHYWEFASVIDGRSAMAHLFERLDETMFVELDIYWASVGGADPISVINDFGDRVQLLHVKDGPGGDPKEPMTAVGGGSIDIGGAIRAASNAAWHIVELDQCATDMFEAVEASYEFLVGAHLSTGRR